MKKSTKQLHIHHKMRVVSVYATALFVAAVVVQALSFGASYLYMRTLVGSNILLSSAGMMVALLAGIIIPLVAYFVGDTSTKSRSPYEHYYNGVLFALLTIVLLLIVDMGLTLVGLGALVQVDAYSQYFPALVALALTFAVGFFYGRKRHQVQLDEYLPFRVLFAGSVLFLAGLTITSQAATLLSGAQDLRMSLVVAPLVFALGILLVTLFISDKRTLAGKLTDAALGLCLGAIAYMLFMQVSWPGFGDEMSMVVLPCAFGGLSWLTFIYYYYYRKV